MDLYFLRHGIAEDFANSDAERKLTQKGIDALEKQVPGIKTLNLEFDLVLASPFVRAKQTVEVVLKGLGLDHKVQISSNITPSGNLHQFILELDEDYRGRKSILVACHEPFISSAISFLTGSHVMIQRGSLSKLFFPHYIDQDAGKLEWVYGPEQQMQLES